MTKTNFSYFEINYLQHLPLDKNTYILDYGSGSGRMIDFLLEIGYTNIEAADIDEQALLHIKEKHNIKTHLITNTTQFLESISATYNVIIAKDVLYYFSSDHLIPNLKLFNTALKKDGLFIAEIFNGSIFTGPYVKFKDFGIQLILNEYSLKDMLLKAGFEIQLLKGDAFPIKGIKSIIYLGMRKSWWVILRFIYFFERGIDNQNPEILSQKIIAVAKSR